MVAARAAAPGAAGALSRGRPGRRRAHHESRSRQQSRGHSPFEQFSPLPGPARLPCPEGRTGIMMPAGSRVGCPTGLNLILSSDSCSVSVATVVGCNWAGVRTCYTGLPESAVTLRAEVRRSFNTTTVLDESQVTPVGFELATNGFQFYAIANLDKISLTLK